ncbi:MAG: glycosyltransferase family 2 protein [Bacteroidaceae bacterium]|nr:glycosyltransferase family 2 protein [Bacteroidaceae bacterium]
MSERPVLSILIITHNQLPLLKRCLESVLKQDIRVPYEIIVSDDRSNDGTDLFMKNFQNSSDNLISIKYVRCNSDDCNPTCISDRCGWNKLNAYNQCQGVFFVNIDADDYLRSNDIYQKQIEMLEKHPECSMCMQRILSIKENEPFDKGFVWPQSQILRDGVVIDKETFILGNLRGLNQGYMIRRRPKDDMRQLYGKLFDDAVITYHHLQYGPIVFIDRADYVWVHYSKSISHSVPVDDSKILYGTLPLFHAVLFPSMRTLFIENGLSSLIQMLKYSPEYPIISDGYIDYFRQFPFFIIKYYIENQHSLIHKIRFLYIFYLLLFLNKYQIKSKVALLLAYKSLI